MAIEYVIDYRCYPKQELGTVGILQRLKDRSRADEVIGLYRARGDERPPSEMGFELTRSATGGAEETQVVVVQHLLDHAAELDPYAPYCAGCPANRTGQPFGCVGYIQYPISAPAEIWLLKQLPAPDEPLIWLLLRQGVQGFGYDGGAVTALRAPESPYFETHEMFARNLSEFQISTNQVFEMIFLLGPIQPNHAAILLLFFNAMRRDLDAGQIMRIAPAPEDFQTRFPFLLRPASGDDQTITELKQFFLALYLAWGLNVQLLLDA